MKVINLCKSWRQISW